MFNIEALYTDNKIDDYILSLASKNLLNFDDLKQSIFLEALESDCENMGDFMRACYRVRYRMKRDAIGAYHLSIPDDDLIPFYDKEIEKFMTGVG